MSSNAALNRGANSGPNPHFDASDIEALERLSDSTSFFKAQRASALTRFLEIPFATSADEQWRYTKPEQFPWERLKNQTRSTLECREFTATGPGKAFSHPGLTLSRTPAELAKVSALIVEALEKKGADLAQDPVWALQQATLTSFAVISVAKKTSIDQPILLSQLFAAAKDLASSSLLIINVEREASVAFVEDLVDLDSAFLASRVEVLVGDNASVRFISAQHLGDNAIYLARHRFHTGKDSRLKIIHVGLGARVSRVDTDLNMYLPGADVELLGVSLADGKRHVDFHPTQNHLAPHCRSDLFMKGVLKGSSRGVYYGYIKVAEGAQKTDAYQKNRNLVLSSAARADSIPNLAIKANDVRCSHGASVSHVSSEDMFYLRARGLPPALAEQLLVEGFLEDLLAKIKDPLIHDWLSERVMERLRNGSLSRKTL